MKKRIKYVKLFLPLALLYLLSLAFLPFGVYDRIGLADDLLHIAGGFLVAYAMMGVWKIESPARGWRVSPSWILQLGILSCVCLVAVVWEWHEYVVPLLIQPSIGDTLLDIGLAMVGAIIYLAFKRK